MEKMDFIKNFSKKLFNILNFLFQAFIVPVLIIFLGVLSIYIIREFDDPLIRAVRAKDVNQVEFLLKHGANVNVLERTFSRDALNPIHLASEYGPIEIVKLLLDHGADVNTKTSFNATPLHFAAQGKYISIAKLLIDRGAQVDAKDNAGRTPLNWIEGKEWASPEMIDFLKFQKIHPRYRKALTVNMSIRDL